MSLLISKKILYISNSQVWGAWASLLFLMSWLDKTSLTIPWVGDLAVILMGITLGGFVLLSMLIHRKAPPTVCTIAGLVGLLVFLYTVSEVLNPIKSFRIVAQLVLVTLCFTGAALLLSRDRAIMILAKLWVLLAILNLVLWIRSGFLYPFEGLFAHKNLLGGLTTFGLFFIWAARSIAGSKKPWWNLGSFISLTVLLASGSRASWLAAIVAITAYTLWPWLTINRQVFLLTFLLMLFFVIGFVFIYISLPEASTFSQMRAIVVQYTGQRLNSGRDVIWPLLINAIEQHPWGYGPGATLERLGFESTRSSHNLFIQVALQTGVIGLVNLFVVLCSIWISFFKRRSDSVVRLAGAFLLAVLVHESFEISLIQNNLTIGIIMWTVFGIGVGRLYLSRPDEVVTGFRRMPS